MIKRDAQLISVISIVLLLAGCVTPAVNTTVAEDIQPAASKDLDTQAEDEGFSDSSDPWQVNAMATAMLRDYLGYYGLINEAESVSIEAENVGVMGAGFMSGAVLLLGVFNLVFDGEIKPAYRMTVFGTGVSQDEATQSLAYNISGMMGDSLFGYFDGKTYDYLSDSLGGYGIGFVTVLGDSQDNAVIEGFFSDLIGRASSILSAAEPLLLDSLTLERRLYPPGEPVGVLQIHLFGSSWHPSGKTSAEVLFDPTGEISARLNQAIDWPDVKGQYLISFVYGLR
jgi:hypothetical protein